MADQQQQVAFTQPAADKIVQAVKQVLAAPTDNTGSRVQQRVNDNRIFWANVAATNITEVFPTLVVSPGPTPTPTGQLTYNTLMSGGRTGTLSEGAQIGDGINSTAMLVRQDFDCTANPPSPIYRAACHLTLVAIGASELVITGGVLTSGTARYSGTIGGTVVPAEVINIGEESPYCNVAVGSHFGMIVGQTSETPSRTKVYVNAPYPAKMARVLLTVDGGSGGTAPSWDGTTWHAGSPPTWTYTCTTPSGIPLGTGMTPFVRPSNGTLGGTFTDTGFGPGGPSTGGLGPSYTAGGIATRFGIGWFESGDFFLWDAGER